MNVPPYDLSTLVGRRISANQTRHALSAVRDHIAGLPSENLVGKAMSLDSALREIASRQNITPDDLFCALRVALCGRLASPGLYEVMSDIGRAETSARLDKALLALGDQA